jgi:hypothetical protein
MKLVSLISMCLTETHGYIWICKHLSDTFSVHNDMKQETCFIPFVLNFASEYAIRYAQENPEWLKLDGIHQLLIYADDKIWA